MGDLAQQQAPVVQPPAPEVTTGAASTQGGRGNGAAQDALLAGGAAAPNYDQREFDRICLTISNKYTQLLLERAAGVEELRQDAGVEDAPPAWQSIAIAVGMIALSAASAGIGTVVAGAIVATSTKIAAQAATEMVKVATEEALKTGLTAAIGGAAGPATNVKDSFFRGQSDALRNASAATQDAFTLRGIKALETSADPIGAATNLLNALEAGRTASKGKQRLETLGSWCNFLARAESGTDRQGTEHEGTALGGQMGDTSGKGVLGVRIEATSPSRPVTIVGAEIEGLNETLRGQIASQSIGSLHMSVNIVGLVNPAGWLEWFFNSRSDDGRLRFGMNESGTLWNDSSYGANRWLHSKSSGGQPQIWGEDGPSKQDLDAMSMQAARQIIDREIKPKTLTQLGVELGG
jgi:hypothetical protein